MKNQIIVQNNIVRVISVAKQGPTGPAGPVGPTGPGVPVGGTTGFFLAKRSDADFDTEWLQSSAPVSSVFGRTGAVLAVNGDYTTDLVTEGSNLYFTTTRARAAISASGVIAYNSTTGVITIQQAGGSQGGYLSSADWTSFNSKQAAITTGSTAQYFRGDLSLATFPTNVSSFANDAAYINQAGARTALSQGTGINYNSGSGVITNSAPDQTVVLNNGANITVTGTYPEFTISAAVPSAGGSPGQVQYNNSGAFGGFGTWDGSTFNVGAALTATQLTGQYSNLAGSAYINPDGSAVFGGGAAAITNSGAITGSNLSGSNSGDITLAGANYLTLAGQVLTANNVNLASQVTGNLPVANLASGTNASSTTRWSGNNTWQANSSSSNGIAAAGTNLATATALTSTSGPVIFEIDSGTGGASLPTANPARGTITVINRSGAAVLIYPSSSAQSINGLGVGVPYVLQNNSAMTFESITTTTWKTSIAFQGGDVNTADASSALTFNSALFTTFKGDATGATDMTSAFTTLFSASGKYLIPTGTYLCSAVIASNVNLVIEFEEGASIISNTGVDLLWEFSNCNTVLINPVINGNSNCTTGIKILNGTIYMSNPNVSNIGTTIGTATDIVAGIWLSGSTKNTILSPMFSNINSTLGGTFGTGPGAARDIYVDNATGFVYLANPIFSGNGNARELDIFQSQLNNVGGIIIAPYIRYNGNCRRILKFQSGNWTVVGPDIAPSSSFVVAATAPAVATIIYPTADTVTFSQSASGAEVITLAAGAAKGTNSTETATFSGTYAAGDTLTLTLTSSAITGSPLTLSYTVLSTDTAQTSAQAFVALVNANAALISAGITSTYSTQVGAKNTNCIDFAAGLPNFGTVNILGGTVNATGFVIGIAESGGGGVIKANNTTVIGSTQYVNRTDPQSGATITNADTIGFYAPPTDFNSGISNSRIVNFTEGYAVQGTNNYIIANQFYDQVDVIGINGSSTQTAGHSVIGNTAYTVTQGNLSVSAWCIRVFNVINGTYRDNTLVEQGNTPTATSLFDFTSSTATGYAFSNAAPSGISPVAVGASAVVNFAPNGLVSAATGGTGLTTLTAHSLIVGNGTSAVQFITPATAGRILIDQGASANPAFESLSGDATITNAGAITVTKTGGVAFATSATTDTTNASNISSGTLPAARLPAPTLSALGGVEAIASVAHQWINAINTSGIPQLLQPAFADLSGQATLAQFPSIAAGTVLANVTGGSAVPTAATPSSILSLISNNQGDILYNNGSAWVALAAGTSGQFLETLGTGANPQWGSPAGTGNVTGPGSSTNTAIAVYSGTGGTTLLNTGVTIDGSNNVAGIVLLGSGAHTITSASATSLTVGPNGATNPVLTVISSVASQADGISISGAAAGSGVTLTATSSGATSPVVIACKGASTIGFSSNGSTKFSVGNTAISILNLTASSAAATPRFSYTGAADTGMTAGTEATSVYWNIGQTRQWASNTIVALQRDFRITPSTHAFVTAGGVITMNAALGIDGPPSAGTNATATSAAALYIAGGAVTNTTTAYGIYVNPPTGASTNYAANLAGPILVGASNATKVTNIRHGITGALVGGTATVTDAGCTANTRYYFTTHTIGTITVPASYYASSRSAGTSFVITSSNAIDTSTVDWLAIEP